ncbi:H-2 class II histocompatibility antigen, E-S beta chain-like [Odontesthes bonariensis]|uniref:H-2 class II histocompatibility antigen, E-S beta chain-like n=1 Tax=Odontesthes bonariensis TaxID=219752 RepID=UPI003F586D13
MDSQSLPTLLLFSLLVQQKGVTSDGKYYHILKTCQFIEKGSQSDTQYLIRYQYNGRLQALYNSSTEKVVGFTKYGREFADEVNNNPSYLQARRHDVDYYCKIQAALVYQGIRGKAVPPTTRLKAVRSNRSEDSEVLVCSAFNFYPRQIRLSWLKDGVVIPDPPGLVVTEMPGGAWRYQVHSYLEERLNTGRNITCMVEHMGLKEPQQLSPGRSELRSDHVALAVGGSVLAVGLSVLIASIAFYYKKTH